MQKLNARDKRTIRFGLIAVVVILIYFVLLEPFIVDWHNTRSRLSIQRKGLQDVLALAGSESAKQAGLAAVVPVLEMPQDEKTQSRLFRDKFNEQLKTKNINVKSLKFLPAKTPDASNIYAKKLLECRGKCSYAQAVDLLTALNQNPYLAGIEQFQLKCGDKDRNQMDLLLTVSTLFKKTN